MPTAKNLNQPDKRLAAVCGLFCPACSIFIATHEDPERLRKLAERAQLSVDDARCEGCRSDKRYPYCKICKMSACAAEKGLDFCGACEEYPCEDLRTFQAERPHRIELWANQARIQEAGYETWFEEMLEHYACPQCGTLNSTYDMTCRKCGAGPSCAYVGLHKEEILLQISKRK
jgi:predicted RNA-binding Zn-ribbon protein involved in translation (DUF1610 family)